MIKRFAFRAASRLVLQPYYRQSRGMTLGTRTVVINAAGEILLVRHTYVAGWLLPGGGVERGETIHEAAIREVREESGIIAGEEPKLMGLYLNDAQFPGDHVACLVLREFSQERFLPNTEIAEARFFDPASLPDGTTAGTRRRIAEALGGAVVSWRW